MQNVALAAYLCVFMYGSLRAEQPQSDLDKLQGEWQATGLVLSGTEWPKPVVKHLNLTIKGDRVSYTLPDYNNPIKPSEVHVEADVTLDPKHHAIDITAPEDHSHRYPLRGIYELQGDVLHFSIPGASTEKRLTRFDSREGSKVNQWTLRRIKP